MKTLLFLITATCVGALGISRGYGADKPETNPEQPPALAPMATGKQPFFQPVSIDPALVRQSMRARSEYDDLNRRIIARQTKLYEENERIKKLQKQLRELQKDIDALMDEDAELKDLRKKQAAITPEMPMGSRQHPATNASPFAPRR